MPIDLSKYNIFAESFQVIDVTTRKKIRIHNKLMNVKSHKIYNDILTSAAESIFKMNADDLILEQCRAREEYERHERTVQKQ